MDLKVTADDFGRDESSLKRASNRQWAASVMLSTNDRSEFRILRQPCFCSGNSQVALSQACFAAHAEIISGGSLQLIGCGITESPGAAHYAPVIDDDATSLDYQRIVVLAADPLHAAP